MISSRSSARAVSFAALVLGLFASLYPTRLAHAQACPENTDIVQWTPAKGPPARFITDTFFGSSATGLWIGLGHTERAFWSAEGGIPNDACDNCNELFLVETKLDGTRTRHKIADHNDWTRLADDTQARKDFVLSRLWRLAKTAWPIGGLKHDYTFTVGKPSKKDPSQAPPFAVEIADARGLRLLYRFKSSTSMCWCIYEWNAESRVARKAP